jgi:uncharacterized membrane protein
MAHGMALRAAAFWIARGEPLSAPKFYKAIVPPPFEQHRNEVNVASGVAELAGGLAVLPARTRPAARWWLLATLLAVYWANIHMALRPEKFPRFKPALLYARLPVQGLFAWLTWRGPSPPDGHDQRFLASTARCSWRLFIRERPEMLSCRASL